ncbi:hypothetical protein [Smaragdicoccus niigatensis]|uniref:hypothetical protein n=1 Tax=Smaragdicoccus niigatensis TaxID=359359 RepID=UPI0003A36A48|nr:hypothetical protein [Smaragdicoccus niigatensis]
MLALGVVLLILGYLFAVPILWTLGIIAVVIGAVLWFIDETEYHLMRRRYWY